MADEQKPFRVPPLKKKNRSLKDVGPNSLAAALLWDRLAQLPTLTDDSLTDDSPEEPPAPAAPVKPEDAPC